MSSRELKWVANAPARAHPIPTAEWVRHRDHITQLHHDGKTRKEISQIMARDFGFKPSAHQYTSQFEKWNLKRYNTAKDPMQLHATTLATCVSQTEGMEKHEDLDSEEPVPEMILHNHPLRMMGKPSPSQLTPSYQTQIMLLIKTPLLCVITRMRTRTIQPIHSTLHLRPRVS